jgi:hypothetical protein
MHIWRVTLPCLAIAVSMAVLGQGPLHAAITTVNFDQFSGMPFDSFTSVPASAQLNDQLLSTLGLRFTSGDSFAAVVNMGADHAVSGDNAIAGTTADGVLSYDRGNPVVVRFYQPGNASVPVTTDFVSVVSDLWGSGQSIALNAYDMDGNLIDSVTAIDSGGTTLELSAAGIHSVQLLGTNNETGVAWDNLTFNSISNPCVIPAPASALLALCGLGFMRAFRRLHQ